MAHLEEVTDMRDVTKADADVLEAYLRLGGGISILTERRAGDRGFTPWVVHRVTLEFPGVALRHVGTWENENSLTAKIRAWKALRALLWYGTNVALATAVRLDANVWERKTRDVR